MALSLPEANRIVQAVQSTAVPFTMAWQVRVDPQNVQIKALMKSGELGRIFMVRRRHGLGVHLWPNFEQMWHFNPMIQIGSCLLLNDFLIKSEHAELKLSIVNSTNRLWEMLVYNGGTL